jgi:Bifunctional DNA primase/polymerase, N-terminal
MVELSQGRGVSFRPIKQRARRRERAHREQAASAALHYAGLGWPVCPGAHVPQEGAARACSCDRIGCPAPGAHPVSPTWQMQASADLTEVGRWWAAVPEANVILVTGRVFDVLDVPLTAGLTALRQMERAGTQPGPVAGSAGGRALFFVATRGAPELQDEWWSCHLDCVPDDDMTQTAGLRWHCRNSYVLAPPSRYGAGQAARWLRPPAGHPLPDAVRLLEHLADAMPEEDS